MIKIFSSYKIIFYSINFFLIFLYLFPGSLIGLAVNNDIKSQPQLTRDFIISSNHFYVFLIVSIIGFFTYEKLDQKKNLKIYLMILSVVLEIFHLFIPQRSFQWSDLFGNLFGVLVVIFIYSLINKYEIFKK